MKDAPLSSEHTLRCHIEQGTYLNYIFNEIASDVSMIVHMYNPRLYEDGAVN